MNFNLGLIYVIVSLCVIGVLLYLYLTCKGHEPFCNCFPVVNKVCPNTKVLTDLYNTGRLTESTDLAKMQRPGWKTVMPEDQFALNNYDADKSFLWNNEATPEDEYASNNYN